MRRPKWREFCSGKWSQWSRKNPSWTFHTFWPPLSQKFWFGLFDRRATRTWDRILRSDKIGQISKFLHWRENLLQHMTPMVSKVSLLEISPIFDGSRPKISIRVFWPPRDQNLGLHFEVRRNESNFEIFPLEREFCSGTWRQWSRKYPSWKFHHFCCPMTKNFDSVCLTFVRPEPVIAFWGATKWIKFPNFCPGKRILLQNMTPVVSKVSLLEILPIFAAPQPKISIRTFWLLCDQNLGSHFEVRRNGLNFQIFSLEKEFCNGTWCHWSRKYPSW